MGRRALRTTSLSASASKTTRRAPAAMAPNKSNKKVTYEESTRSFLSALLPPRPLLLLSGPVVTRVGEGGGGNRG